MSSTQTDLGPSQKKELLKVLTGNTGEKIRQAHGNKAVENFLDEYDVSGDAQIDFEEFMEMLQNVKDTFVDSKAGHNDSGGITGSNPGSATAAGLPATARQQSRGLTGTSSARGRDGSAITSTTSFCPCTNILRGLGESIAANKVEATFQDTTSATRRTGGSPTSARKSVGVSEKKEISRLTRRRSSNELKSTRGRS